MSSMRNVVQRRNHKERAQPLERSKWGVLEKHKDYSLRAKDYNAKKARLKALRHKAAERNPDEFHFAMMSSSTHNGGQRVADRGNKALSMEVVKLLKTQDAAYLRTVAQKTRRARERLEEEFVLSGEGKGSGVRVLGKAEKGGQKVVWVGSREEQKRWGEEDIEAETDEVAAEERDSLDEEDIEITLQSKQAPRKALIEAQKSALHAGRALRKRHKREQEARRSKLEALKIREKDLMTAEHELEMQRAKMSSSIGGVTKAGLKWKVRERKR
ncbi:hypothetical protein MMC17_009542 [Xylographa soralifera]|nr:hypothetical protein [Xylographa soralifera]